MRGGKFGLVKSFILVVTITILFFAGLETIQRVRYFFRFRSPYWLMYGFVKPPEHYDEMHERGILRQKKGVEVIELSVLFYGGYRKYNPRHKGEDYTINSFGFRGAEFEIDKKQGEYRIIALGGSTTFGTYMKDDSTYPALLEKKLNSNAGQGLKYQVINAGVGASTIAEIRRLYEKEIADLNPDAVLINCVFNNLYYSSNTVRYRGNFLQEINKFLLDRSLFYVTLREKLACVSKLPAGDVYKAPMPSMLDNFINDSAFWKDWEQDLEAMERHAQKNNIKVILIIEPVWLRDHRKDACGLLLDEQLKPLYDKAATLIEDVAKKNKIAVVDAFGYFYGLPDKERYFVDGLHLTEKGNALLADLVYDTLTTLPKNTDAH